MGEERYRKEEFLGTEEPGTDALGNSQPSQAVKPGDSLSRKSVLERKPRMWLNKFASA